MTDSAMTPESARTLARERVQLEVRAIMLAMVAQPGTPLPDAFDEHFDRALGLYGRVMTAEAKAGVMRWVKTRRHRADWAELFDAAAWSADEEYALVCAELERADGRGE